MSPCLVKPTKDKHLFGVKPSMFVLSLADVETVAVAKGEMELGSPEASFR